ncbi:MAG TPA: class I SAM-dependent methyltransferase [Allosphingosinicella sp.]|nr:class I SAM-dependent methyltransferase [Allosphingosinicella sp.]
MPKRPFVRALLFGAGAALVILIFYVAPWRPAAPPAPQENRFNPAALAGPAPQLDAPYLASPGEVVDAMLGIARLRPEDFVIDLGSGDGRILIAAARSNGARGLGVDIDPARIAEAEANARAAGVTGLVSFRREDLFRTPLAQADILTLYLSQEVNLRLRPRILAQMRPGTRVVSHEFDMGDWRWDDRRRAGAANVYLWIVPARVAGNWTLTRNGRSVQLVLAQRYQQVTGTAGEARVEQGRVSGAGIRFITNLGQGRETFEGRVEGDTIVPTDAQAGWRAVRAG